MPSAIIRRFRYFPDRQELAVELVTGSVPEHEADAFRAAYAKGVHFNRYIRRRYPYRELSEELD